MTDDPVKQSIVELIADKGPMGWRGIEIRLRVPRDRFADGYTLMTYLDELVTDGALQKGEDEKYIAP